MYETVTIATGLGDSLTDITDQVRAVVKERAVKSGVCLVVVPHTTAAITINSGMDPATVQDVVEDVRRLVPTRTISITSSILPQTRQPTSRPVSSATPRRC